MISVGWGKCDPTNPRNRRLRPSILIEQDLADSPEDPLRLLIDASPDLREQLIQAQVNRLDGVIFTHAHADHVHGLDDLREVNRVLKGPLQVYGDVETLADLNARFAYAFMGLDLSREPIYRPWLVANRLSQPCHFLAGSRAGRQLALYAFSQDHGYGHSLGLRVGDFAYCTDVVDLSEQAFSALEGVKVLMIGVLTNTPHPTHAHVDKALEWANRLGPERAILTHMSPGLDYDTLKNRLPKGVEPAWDGMVIEV